MFDIVYLSVWRTSFTCFCLPLQHLINMLFSTNFSGIYKCGKSSIHIVYITSKNLNKISLFKLCARKSHFNVNLCKLCARRSHFNVNLCKLCARRSHFNINLSLKTLTCGICSHFCCRGICGGFLSYL
jgi:hypothetical protein